MDRDSDLARQVIHDDALIDREELEIDRLCMEVLATQQLMAGDLRYITTAMKVNADLERIADHAANICEPICDCDPDCGSPIVSFFELMAPHWSRFASGVRGDVPLQPAPRGDWEAYIGPEYDARTSDPRFPRLDSGGLGQMVGVGRPYQWNHRPRLLHQPGERELAQRHAVAVGKGPQLGDNAGLTLRPPVLVG